MGGNLILTLVQVFFDPLRLAQKVRRMFFRNLDEFFYDFHRGDEFLGKFFVLLVLPGAAERGKTRLERGGFDLDIVIKTLQFFCKAPDFLRIHDRLSHRCVAVTGVEMPRAAHSTSRAGWCDPRVARPWPDCIPIRVSPRERWFPNADRTKRSFADKCVPKLEVGYEEERGSAGSTRGGSQPPTKTKASEASLDPGPEDLALRAR